MPGLGLEHEHRGQWLNWYAYSLQPLSVHETPRCMYPDEIVSILQRNKHSRIGNIFFDRNRWGERAREDQGMSPHGTLFITGYFERTETNDMRQGEFPSLNLTTPTKEEQKNAVFVMPANCIPYTTIRGSDMENPSQGFRPIDPVGSQGGTSDETTVRGWRPCLEHLLKEGILAPSEELRFLTGVDPYAVCPRMFWA